MQLNSIRPACGARVKANRVGRGIGSGSGKTCGKGHKGQKARTGVNIPVGFEGGQMPIQRRLPKFGFTSYMASITAEIRLHELNKVDADVIDLAALRAANLISGSIKRAKIIGTGKIEKAVTIRGLKATKGAKAAIEAAGGKIEE